MAKLGGDAHLGAGILQLVKADLQHIPNPLPLVHKSPLHKSRMLL